MTKMEKELEEAIYSSDEDSIMKIIYKDPSLIQLALQLSIRYDRPLIINVLVSLIQDETGESKTSIIERATMNLMRSIIYKDNMRTMNSIVYNDPLNLYIILRVSAQMGNTKYFNYSLSKIDELGLGIDPSIWNEIAISTIGSISSNSILRGILSKHISYIDIPTLAKEIVVAQSISKLDIILQYRRYIDINSLLIYAMESNFNDSIDTLLQYVNRDESDRVVEVAVSTSNMIVVDTLISYYSGDISILILMSIDREDSDMYRYLMDMNITDRSAYPTIAISLARHGMLEELIDLLSDIDDYTPIIVELISNGYTDLIGDIIDIEPDVLDLLPIMTEAYKRGEYMSIRDTLLSYKKYVTPIVEMYDEMLTQGNSVIPILRRSTLDMRVLRPYLQHLNMYDLDRQISMMNRYR